MPLEFTFNMKNCKFPWFFPCLTLLSISGCVSAASEKEAEDYLIKLESKHNLACNQMQLSQWQSEIDSTVETLKSAEHELNVYNQFLADIQKQVNSQFPNWKNFSNARLRKAFKVLATGGPGSMPLDRVQKMNKLLENMKQAYSTATVCQYNNPNNCTLTLHDIDEILSTTDDPKEMKHYFIAWHDKMSELVSPERYKQFIDFENELATANGFSSMSAMWLDSYNEETSTWSYQDFEKDLSELQREVGSIYEILHAYVRMKLRELPQFEYLIDKCGYLPAYILGNMWAQTWTKIGATTKPFPNTPTLDATNSMKMQGYTPLKMYQVADDFYKSLGLRGMYPEFYNNSVIEKLKTGQQMGCHPTAFDSCNGKGNRDFRIRMCTKVNHYDFTLVHHEMGHIAYYQEYTDLEFVFRNGANLGFHEAIGDTLTIAVMTPDHLQCELGLDLGLDESYCQNHTKPFNVSETDLNFLYLTALNKVPLAIFAIAVETWRFGVFDGQIKPEEYNKQWWGIRKQYQGIVSPGNRANNSRLFDPAAKYHVVADYEYTRYFVASILQFQLYEAMCIASGQFNPKDPNGKPLYQCNFSGSKEAGKLLSSMLKMGSSQAWPDALEVMSGSRKMSVKPMKHYFQPILDYMKKELKANDEPVGFGDSCGKAQQMNK